MDLFQLWLPSNELDRCWVKEYYVIFLHTKSTIRLQDNFMTYLMTVHERDGKALEMMDAHKTY